MSDPKKPDAVQQSWVLPDNWKDITAQEVGTISAIIGAEHLRKRQQKKKAPEA